MSVESVLGAACSPNSVFDATRQEELLNKLQQYNVLSNAISVLFDPSDGVVPNAAVVQSKSSCAVGNTSAAGAAVISPVTLDQDPTPTDETSARIQVAGLMALYNSLVSGGSTSHLSDSLKAWILDRLTKIEGMKNAAGVSLLDADQTDKTTPFKDLVDKAIADINNPAAWKTFWNNLDPKVGPTPMITVMNFMLNSISQPSMTKPDDDTMFALIMFYNDVSQSQPGKFGDIGASFFGYYKKGSISSAGVKYAEFIAIYMNQHDVFSTVDSTSNSANSLLVLKSLLRDKDPTKDKDLPEYGGFFARLQEVSQGWTNTTPVVLPQSLADHPDIYRNWTLTIWNYYLNDTDS